MPRSQKGGRPRWSYQRPNIQQAADTESLSDSESYASSYDTPSYTPQEFQAIFLDFYQFLATLHYDSEFLKIPPPEGWTFTPEFCSKLGKSDLVIEVLRHLPYFDKKCIAYIHYKSWLLDFTTYSPDLLKDLRYRDDLGFCSCEGSEIDPVDVVCIADGRESMSRQFFFNVKDGGITEDMIRGDTLDTINIEDFFNKLKGAYRSLQLIPCPGRIPIDADRVGEADECLRITQEEVLAQKRDWGTDLDIQYIRQLYRQYGWPDNFQKGHCYEGSE